MAGYDPQAIEKEILAFWDAQKIFDKLRARNSGGKAWSFIDGPMTANNPMGVHHAWGRTWKDLYQRFKAMQGFDQRYQNGHDCHGLWIEVEVEKERGFKDKKDIERFGKDNFIQACKERVDKFAKVQAEQSKRLGQWMDWENSYYTNSDNNIEHIWHFLKRCHEKGWLVKKETIMPWCYRCGTALSKHELSDEGWAELTHPGVFVKYPLVGKEKEFLLVWTTTSWTLPANVVVAVNPNLKYVKVRQGDEHYWLAKAAVKMLKGEYEEVEEVTGMDMAGAAYMNGFEDLPAQKGVAHNVVEWDIASEEEGTGMVHVAPGCGDVDFELGKETGLPALAPLDEYGFYMDGYGWLKGKHAKDVAEEIAEHLRKKNMLYKVEPYTHRYPVCWRCKTELVFRLVSEWFIRSDEIRQPMKDAAAKVKWYPEHVGKLMEDWLTNMGDWCISRKRYWGLPLMFFPCKCGELAVIGSRKELREKAVKPELVDKLPELHDPWLGEIRVKCKCGEEVQRIPEVGDAWLDAGIVPFSTLKYLTDKEHWEKWFPAEFITEMRAQVRLWYYAMLFMSVTLEDRGPYKVVLNNEEVRDEKGKPMHKSLGNAIWFDDAVEKIGADVMRWIYCGQNPHQNLRFGFGIAADVKKRLNVFYNLAQYVKTYLELNGFQKKGVKDLNTLNKWFLSNLEEVKKKVAFYLDTLKPHKAHEVLENYFLNDFSRFYVHLVRDKLKKDYKGEDKGQVMQAMYTGMLEGLKLLAPFMPFVTEKLYQDFYAKFEDAESIHLTDWPKADGKAIDTKLGKEMEIARAVVESVSAARQDSGVKLRWPLDSITFVPKDREAEAAIKNMGDAIRDLANVKELKFAKGLEKPVEFHFGKFSLGEVLKDEALVKELVRKTQILRKENKLTIGDRITIYLKTDPETEKLLVGKQEEILAGVGADKAILREVKEKRGELEFEGRRIEIGFEKAK
jgi:isoleucyl-tRNA synthetase